MAVLDGEIEEAQFHANGHGALVEGGTKRYAKGEVGFIRDEIALHLIRPAAGRRGVSLHLYADPIDRCRVYDRGTGSSQLIDLSYDSVRGERCNKPASAVRAEWGV